VDPRNPKFLQGIQPGSAAKRAEDEKRAGSYPEIEDDVPKPRMGAQGEVFGRRAYGFTLSSRVGKPFRLDETASSPRGEALPAEQHSGQQEEIQIEIERKTPVTQPSKVESLPQEDVAAGESDSSFHAFLGSLLKTLSFRNRS